MPKRKTAVARAKRSALSASERNFARVLKAIEALPTDLSEREQALLIRALCKKMSPRVRRTLEDELFKKYGTPLPLSTTHGID